MVKAPACLRGLVLQTKLWGSALITANQHTVKVTLPISLNSYWGLYLLHRSNIYPDVKVMAGGYNSTSEFSAVITDDAQCRFYWLSLGC